MIVRNMSIEMTGVGFENVPTLPQIPASDLHAPIPGVGKTGVGRCRECVARLLPEN